MIITTPRVESLLRTRAIPPQRKAIDDVYGLQFLPEYGPLVDRVSNPVAMNGSEPILNRVHNRLWFVEGVNGMRQTPPLPTGRVTQQYTWWANDAMFTFQRSGNSAWLVRSDGGTAAWQSVLGYTGFTPDSLPDLLVDCGSGRMLLVEYGTSGSRRLWGSKDGGENWGNNGPGFDNGEELIYGASGTFLHFHGGRYDSVTDAVVLFTGDSNSASRMLYCDDIDDLFENPNTWKTRWGLDSENQPVSADYVLNDNLDGSGLPNSQDYRAVSADFASLDGRRYIVWAEDTGRSGGQNLWRQDITDGANGAKALVQSGIIGAGWITRTLENGNVLTLTDSETSGGSPIAGHDLNLHWYATPPTLDRADHIAQWERNDAASPSGSAVWWSLIESYGRVMAWNTYTGQPTVIGRVGSMAQLFRDEALESNFDEIVTPVPKQNLIINPRMVEDTTGWPTVGSATVNRDTALAPPGEIACLRITPSANTSGVRQRRDELGLELGGQPMQLRFRYMIDGSLGTQNPAVLWDFGGGLSSFQSLSNTNGEWVTVVRTTRVPLDVATCQINFYASFSAVPTAVDLHIADVSLSLGRTAPGRSPGITASVG